MVGIHPLVLQLKFTRNEFRRGLKGLSDEDARKRLMPMNCISWNVGHLAWQEQRYFLYYGQGLMPFPDVQEAYSYGAPASTPYLSEVLAYWRKITAANDSWLESLTTEKLQEHYIKPDGKPGTRILGALLLRTIIITGTIPAKTWRYGRCWGTLTCRNSWAISIARRPTCRNKRGMERNNIK